ncbi:glycosyltransferase family 2 protein [Microbacterium pumilum]|uniref:Glycosyltransferase 2-like domain-containing protein n=1 Tax=Microbacterium pumilum TaxID=344165 RepID=A0ABP5DME5_9MICO
MNASRPTVSVIVPAYRAAKQIEQMVLYLLRQDEEVLEVIIVADGAVDETPEIAVRLDAAHSRVRAVILPENVGVARAREAGVRAAVGDFVLFADADDSMPSDAIARLVDEAMSTGADVVIGSAEVLRPSGDIDFVLRGPREFRTVSRLFAFRLLLRGVITGHLWNKLIRRPLLEASLPFPTSDVHSDLALTARTLAKADRVTFTDHIVYRYHANAGSILKSGRSRLLSLDRVEASVSTSASEVDPRLLVTEDYRYFVARFISLSRVKDALVGPYSPGESRRLARTARRRLGWEDFALTVRRRDLRRAAMILSAKVSLTAHGSVLSRGRDSTDVPIGGSGSPALRGSAAATAAGSEVTG